MALALGISFVAGLLGMIGTPPPGPRRRWLVAAGGFVAFVALGAVLARIAWYVEWNTAPVASAGIAAVAGIGAATAPWLLRDAAWTKGTSQRAIALVSAVTAMDAVVLFWLADAHYRGDAQDHATVAGSFQSIVLVCVAALGVKLVAEMQLEEQADRDRKRAGEPSEPDFETIGKVRWFRIIGLGLAAGVLVVRIGGEIARIDGFDAHARHATYDFTLPIAVGAIACLGLAVVRWSAARETMYARGRVAPTHTEAVAVVAAAVAWALVPHTVNPGGYAQGGWTAAFAALLGAVTAHSLWFHAGGEHLTPLSWGAIAMVAGCAVAVASTLFWLLSAALVVKHEPVRAVEGANIAIAVVVINGCFTTLVGGILARRRGGSHLSRYSPQQGIANDVIAYTGLSLLVAAAPALLVAHIRSAPPSNSRTLVLVTVVLVAVVQAGRFIPIFVRNMRSYIAAEEEFVKAHFPDDPREVRHFKVTRAHFTLLTWLLWFALSLALLWALSALI